MSEPYTKDQQAIIKYLKEQIADGKMYFKAKHMGKSLNMSSYSIGTNLFLLSKACKSLKIVQWSTTSAVTWKVEPAKRNMRN